MAAVVQLAEVVPTVSLYVNDYNLPARATYARVGFTEVGESRRFTFEGLPGVAGSTVDRAVDHVWLRDGGTASRPYASRGRDPWSDCNPWHVNSVQLLCSVDPATAFEAETDQRDGSHERRSALAQHPVVWSAGGRPATRTWRL